MKKKRTKRFLKLDYTTTLIVGAAALAVFSLGIILTNHLIESKRNKTDHKRPLEITNLAYCNGEKLDLFVPQSSSPVPLVIYIHGGGWQYGSKIGGTLSLVKPLVQKNMAVASINYRLSGSAKFPAQIQDVFCAVRYLRAHADQYNIDSKKVGLIGISAGAHLAVLAANASNQPEFIKGPYEKESSKVQAVVGINGMYDFTASMLKKTTETNIEKLTGNNKQLRTSAGGNNYVSKDSSPQLLIYSNNDMRVKTSQTTNFYSLLQKNNVTSELLKINNAGHNLEPYLRFSTSPSQDAITEKIGDFFNKQLEI